MSRKKFGKYIRRERLTKKISLREMAKKIAVSPTYLSKIERDEIPPPAEGKVRAIADIIGHDADELLALADRVSEDLLGIILSKPKTVPPLLRRIGELSDEDMTHLWSQVNAMFPPRPLLIDEGEEADENDYQRAPVEKARSSSSKARR